MPYCGCNVLLLYNIYYSLNYIFLPYALSRQAVFVLKIYVGGGDLRFSFPLVVWCASGTILVYYFLYFLISRFVNEVSQKNPEIHPIQRRLYVILETLINNTVSLTYTHHIIIYNTILYYYYTNGTHKLTTLQKLFYHMYYMLCTYLYIM